MKRLLRLLLSRTTFILLLLAIQITFFIISLNLIAQYAYLHYFMYGITFLVVAHLIYKEENPAYKLSWIIPIIIFPLFGGLFYLFYKNQNVSKKHLTRYFTYEKIRREKIHQTENLSNSKVASYLYELGFPTYKNTVTTFLENGEVAFKDIKHALSKANDYIYLNFFIINDGKLWQDILSILKEKASKGVEIKLIYDDFGSSKLPYRYHKKLKKMGINAYPFNPIRPHLNFQMNYRSHRKLIIIDGITAYTGGINIGDEYINLEHPFGYWQDAAVKIQGDAIEGLLQGFNDQLKFMLKAKVKLHEKPKSHQIKRVSEAIPFFDAPLDTDYTNKNVFMQLIHEAKTSIKITTPYLIIDYDMVSALKFAVKSGVKVDIIIPYTPDKRIVYMVTESYAKELSQAGINIYKFKPGFIHSKLMTIDDQEALIGTVNLDYRSLYLHFENNLYIKKDETVQSISKHINDLIDQSINYKDSTNHNIIYRALQIIFKGFSSIL